MESNNYECFITNTVEAMLPRFSSRDVVLTMKINVDWHDFGYDKEDGNTQVREQSQFRKEIFLVFHRPSNYTKVLMLEIPKRDYNNEDKLKLHHLPSSGEYQMKQLSDHDSCWRSDGMRWVFQAFVDAWDYFDKEIGIEGRDVDPMFGYSIFGGGPQYWKINKLELVDPSDRWSGDYIIEFDKKIGLDEISEYMQDTHK